MSDKKNIVIDDEPEDEHSGIEIVTVGVKNSSAEVKVKEPAINVIPPAPAEDDVGGEDQKPPVHTHLGQKMDEEKIREHVSEVLHEIEGDESDEQREDGSQSNIPPSQREDQSSVSQKSEKSRRRRADKSNYESNDQRREQLPSSRRCFNKLCTSKKIFKKIRSRVQQNKYRFFCKSCYQNYYNNLYCEFCQQIYSTNGENQDDDKWIGCDHCDRWNHVQCQRKFRDKQVIELKDKNLPYDCLVCSQRTKVDGVKSKKLEKEVEEKIPTKQKIQINRDNRTPIFHKKYESFPNLEYFLQNYNFRLWMNEGQIREDIQHLRSVSQKNNHEDSGKNKFKKVKND